MSHMSYRRISQPVSTLTNLRLETHPCQASEEEAPAKALTLFDMWLSKTPVKIDDLNIDE